MTIGSALVGLYAWPWLYFFTTVLRRMYAEFGREDLATPDGLRSLGFVGHALWLVALVPFCALMLTFAAVWSFFWPFIVWKGPAYVTHALLPGRDE